MSGRCSFAVPACLILLVGGSPAVGQPDKPVVSLLLFKASAERSGRDVLFRCEAALDNAAGKDLTVQSNFFSVFDGVELVVTAPDGKVLAQQPYTFHQSPYTLGQTFTLKQGRTEQALKFPVPAADLPRDVKAVKVRLMGTLPGSDYRRILSSDTLEIEVK